jgi:class 3 adenylate cyclase
MGPQHTRDFSEPDDTVRGTGLVLRRITLGAHTVSRSLHQPGWRWSGQAPSLGATELCQTHHVGYGLSGSLHVVLVDGTEFDVTEGSVFDIPPGHDAWVTSAVPYETLDWVGARSWLGERSVSSGTLATVLFTDVVDSSGEARTRGDLAWSDVNATLDSRTRDLVVEFGGEVLKSTGDGALAVFASVGRAVRCGIELVATAPLLGLSIRVGIHTGEVETIAGDVHGLAVHEAARVLAAATPGEVLVSEVTRAIAGGPGLAFTDRGDHDLKGIGSRRLFAAAKSA